MAPGAPPGIADPAVPAEVGRTVLATLLAEATVPCACCAASLRFPASLAENPYCRVPPRSSQPLPDGHLSLGTHVATQPDPASNAKYRAPSAMSPTACAMLENQTAFNSLHLRADHAACFASCPDAAGLRPAGHSLQMVSSEKRI